MAVCATYRIPHSELLSWSQPDRDKAIWYQTRQAEACPGCGTRGEEWEHDHNAYIAKKQRCRGCEIRAQLESTLDEKRDGRGVSVVLRRRRDT